MLSRVANTLYWMVRYIERADNLARLIDVNRQLLLDFERIDSERRRALWRPIMMSTGDEGVFAELCSDGGAGEVVRFLTEDRRNPNSIVSCIVEARENARMVRDQLSDDLWEELNALFLFVNSARAHDALRGEGSGFYEAVRRSSQTFMGIAGCSMSRSEAWDFMELGRYLERADKTTRFLDVTSYLPEEAVVGGRTGLYGPAILRSCSALGAFRSEQAGELTIERVVRFLLFSAVFPRSVRFCVERVNQSLHQISGSPAGSFANRAERSCGRVLSELSFGSPEEVFEAGLHSFLDGMQQRFNEIGDGVFEAYVLMPDKIAVSEAAARQPGAAEALRLELEQIQQQQ